MDDPKELCKSLIENEDKQSDRQNFLIDKSTGINNTISIGTCLSDPFYKNQKTDANNLSESFNNQQDSHQISNMEQQLQDQPKKFTSFNIDEDLTWKNGPKKVLDLIIFSMQSIVYNSSYFIVYICNMYFVSKEQSSELIAGFGLASTFIAAFGFASIYAMNYGMQALGSQAYGAGKFELVGIIFQRGLFICIMYLIIISPLFFFLKDVLDLIGIHTIEETQVYSRWSLIYVFLICIERNFRTYLNCQREYFIPTYCAVGAYIFHPLWLYLLCTRAKKGLVGVAWAMAITESLTLISSLLISTWRKKYSKTWPGFQLVAIKGCWEYLKVSISVGASSYIEWFSFELQTIIVGLLNDEDQMAAHSAQVSLILFYFMMPMALNQTIGTYLGNAVGAGQVRLTKNIIKLTLISILILTSIMIGVGVAIQQAFIDLYSTNDNMSYYFKSINNIYIYFFMIGDNIQSVFQGILRTIGKSKWANVIFLGCFLISGTCLSYVLVHISQTGSQGAWWAYGSSAHLAVVFLAILYKKTNIEKCVETISEQVKAQDQAGAGTSHEQSQVKNARNKNEIENKNNQILQV